MPIRFKQDGYVPGSNGIRFQPGGNIIRAYSSGPTDPADVADPNVSLLLHMDGSNGSTTFTDSSWFKKTVTAFGNAQISTSASKFGGASGYFDGTGDYLRVPYSSDFDLSGGDFTIEAWINFSVVGGHLVGKDTYGANFDWSIGFGANNIVCYTNGTWSSLVVTVPAWSTGVWYHVALVRSSGTNTFYVNGTAYGSNTMSITNASQSYMTVGCVSWNNPGYFFNGYIDELRISKVARYTSNFTPSTTRFANSVPVAHASGIVTSNLVLDLDAGNLASYAGSGSNWLDLNDQANNATLSNSPTYSTNNGGILSFNGTNQYGSVSSVNGVTNFTTSNNYSIEVWLRISSTQNDLGNADNNILEKWNSNSESRYPYVFRYDRGNLKIGFSVYDGSNNPGLYFSITTNSWLHVVATFNHSGQILTCYLNGVSQGTTSLSSLGSIGNSSLLGIARRHTPGGGGMNYFTGDMPVVRIYDKSLSGAEVLQNFDALKSRYGL